MPAVSLRTRMLDVGVLNVLISDWFGVSMINVKSHLYRSPGSCISDCGSNVKVSAINVCGIMSGLDRGSMVCPNSDIG